MFESNDNDHLDMDMSNQSEKLNKSLFFAFNVGLLMLYIFGYVTVFSTLKNEAITKWLFSHIVFSSIQIILSGHCIFISLRSYFQIMSENDLKKRLGYFCNNLASMGFVLTSCYFSYQFITKNNIYANYQFAQMAIDAIAIIIIINFVYIGLIVLLIFLIVIFSLFLSDIC
jgi:hypothetical protein